MDSKTALDKIRQAEKEAQDIIEQAKNQARKILQEAKSEKENIIRDAQAKARLDSQKLKVKLQEETLAEIALIKNQTNLDIQALKEKAQRNMDQAAGFLKGKIDYGHR